ncbi:SNF2 family N-terminal domain-containing protein [Mycena metata]|uniref:DNA helicase n=1 Tax=Mycena metata TaxID=1033252 RepID=A0AAD7KEU5_9AGAR|nr:SNF2 family N-terminal domain-containing protein [Mycena metata]
MSSPDDPASRKAAALDHLRFTKRQNNPSVVSAASSSPAGMSSTPAYQTPPAQSRDATVPSRYFTPNIGNVLVPSSSPLGPSTLQPYAPYNHPRPRDVAAVVPNFQSKNPKIMYDPLSAPSAFTMNGTSVNALGRRPWDAGVDGHVAGAREEGPPRKRPNLGPATIDLTDSPDSPQVRRAGSTRRPVSGVDTSSDEDFLPESIIAGPSKPRITRSRPPPTAPPPPAATQSDDVAYNRFVITMPGEDKYRVESAWLQSGKDVKRATALVSDPKWSPPPLLTPASSATPSPNKDAFGRVKEVDEATKAQRLATKEMGKRSAIYANRTTIDTTQWRHYTPPQPVERTVSSPAPRALPPRRRITRKLVVDSDSEPDYSASGDEDESRARPADADKFGLRALVYFNTSSSEALQELTGCTPEQAAAIIELREFESIEDLETKLNQGKKKAGPAGISPRIFSDCTQIFEGYGSVDSVLEECEVIGNMLRKSIASWTSESAKELEGALAGQVGDGALSLLHIEPPPASRPKDYLVAQPELLSNTVQLKEYQLLGVNWLNLLYRKNLSCILADEMGLGKTIQVISFFAHLKAQGNKGPHLVVVPSSTLENWCREFARFAPSIAIQTYYAGKEERVELRDTLVDTQRCKSLDDQGWEVLITTYNLAQGDDRDRKFFRKIKWDSCVFDEGHVLKNFQSQRYQTLLKFGSKWRLLLTGTPLQNNLQELVSLMNFILPEQFSESMTALRAIFKVKGDSKVSLLSQERVSRAKKMMTPFVLRRRKDQVLTDLPKKTERIEWCEMTALQKSIYSDTLSRSRKFVLEIENDESREGTATPPVTANKKKGRSVAGAAKQKKSYLENSSNVLMDLRKGALHPMLFRTLFTDEILTGMTKQLLKEPDFKKRGALFELVKEDMTVMTDAELQLFCATYKSTRKYLQDNGCYLDAGKVQTLLRLLDDYRGQGRKVLIFSQFTQVLDILQAILKQREIQYLLLTGSTPVDVRQSLVDEFSEQETISVFLLSTKAGGMGINLTAASVVIMFDQDFNPHNDRQAQDRAYRIGQKRDVEVIKLISRGTIEEDMLRLGETKLALDEAVAGDTEEKGDVESAPEREMKTSLLAVLRQQFAEDGGSEMAVDAT